ncbi:MAG: hypothetical protein RLZZ241_1693 [Bacteroidota bacterium]|jgi:hypothetical protein
MKRIVLIVFGVTFSLIGCVSHQNFVESPPFSINFPTFQEVIAGREGASNQLKLSMSWQVVQGNEVIPDTLFFRNMAAAVTLEYIGQETVLSALFEPQEAFKSDLIMEANSIAEVGNQPPYPLGTHATDRFNLDANAAVLQYHLKGGTRRFYYQIRGLRENAPIIRPAKPF